MTKILATIGPASDGKRLKFIVKRYQLIRFNTSHNSLKWHEQNINQIKKIDPNKLILVDIPGIKPRTSNIKSIQIKKGAIVKFSNRKKAKNIIQLSNPTPKIKKKRNIFHYQMELTNLDLKVLRIIFYLEYLYKILI